MLHLILNIGYFIMCGLMQWRFEKVSTLEGFFNGIVVIVYLDAIYLLVLLGMTVSSLKKYRRLKNIQALINVCISLIIIFVNIYFVAFLIKK